MSRAAAGQVADRGPKTVSTGPAPRVRGMECPLWSCRSRCLSESPPLPEPGPAPMKKSNTADPFSYNSGSGQKGQQM